MTVLVKHTKVSTIPDDTDTSLIRPSDWNADHTLTGLGTMAEQNANAVAITGGTINGTTIGATTATTGAFTTLTSTGGAVNGTVGATTPATGKFSTLESTGTGSFGTTSAQYIQAVGNALYPQILAVGSGTNIPLVLQPKGTGALQAQLTDSTATGGNARGARAVDLQMERGGATKVASATNSFIGGGYDNVVSGGYGSIIGGYSNTASGTASNAAGQSNTASGTFGSVLGGYSNTASGYDAVVVNGYSNTAAGYFNFIGTGYTNSANSGSAVTTQATTTVTSGSTAVTLSGSNANIKVGQLITGTGIGIPNYVAAISGTSLTLAINATGSGSPTLSFFTPHGVVVGGGNNQASGSYSFIGGGGDGGTAANRNVASGLYGTVVGGRGNTASGIGSFVGGGGVFLDTVTNIYPNTASGAASVVVGGLTNTASQSYSTVLGGFGNTANGVGSTVMGIQATARSINGNFAYGVDGAVAFTQGISQAASLILGRQTTDATATALTSNSSAAGTTNQVILPNNSAYFFTGEVISGVTGGGDTKGWTIEGVIKRGANAAATTLVGVTVTSMYADVGAATWTIAVTADTTNGGLRVTFTGQASTTIRTVCQIRTTEMTY